MVICWVFAFCHSVDVVKIFLITSTVWIAEQLTKKHQRVKPSKTGDITLDDSGLEKTDLTLSRESAFLLVTPEQVGIFKLRLITWMVKKHISYSQVENKDFWKFIDIFFWELLARKYCYFVLAIPFEVGYWMSINGAGYIYVIGKIFFPDRVAQSGSDPPIP